MVTPPESWLVGRSERYSGPGVGVGEVIRSAWGGGGGSDSHMTPRDSSRICGFEGQQAVGEYGQGHWGPRGITGVGMGVPS